MRNPLPRNVLTTNFSTASLQAVIWTSGDEPSINDVLKLATTNWAGTFDGEPVILPTLPSLPSAVPRLTLTSSDQVWRLQMAAHRLDLFWSQVSADAIPIAQNDFSKWASDSIRAFLGLRDSLKVTRMAFVIKRFAVQPEPALKLAEYFIRPELRDGPLNRPGDFQLHAHKSYTPHSMPTINSWVRWSTGLLAGPDALGIILEQDLNTLAEADRTYTVDEVGAFFMLAQKESDEILSHYVAGNTAPGR